MGRHNNSETVRTLTVGAVTLTIAHEYDETGSYNDLALGEWCDKRDHRPVTADQKLVHESGVVLDHHGIWRDEHGHIQAEPEESSNWRSYHYTFHDNGHDKIAYALADHKRMVGLNNGDWHYIGIVVTVTVDGAEVAQDSLWGIESDGDRAYFQEVTRDCYREAMRQARAWFGRRQAAIA